MEIGPPVPPHVVRDIAKDSRASRDNIAKTNLIFFMRTPLRASWMLWSSKKRPQGRFFCLLGGNPGLLFAQAKFRPFRRGMPGEMAYPPVWPAASKPG